MEKKIDDKILEFYNACTDLQNAKLILADVKIGNILKCIVSSGELFAVVGECLVNFSFENEFRKAQVKNDFSDSYFALPSNKQKLVALVFSILSACDTNQLDLHSFIRNFFSNDSNDMSYGFLNFVHKVIFPFRDALCSMVNFEDSCEEQDECETCNENEECEIDEEDVLGNFFNDVTRILSHIKETIKEDTKVKPDRKSEILITIDALVQTVDLGNLKIMNALLISLYYLLSSVKSVRFYKDELEQRFAEFYSELEE